jgi:hypothetical protein
MNKINLETVEINKSFVVWESAIYIVFFIEYIFHTGNISKEAEIGFSFFTVVIIIIFAVINYLLLRSSFYNKLRVRSRI